MSKEKIIKDHYQKVAKNFGDSGRCTIQDPVIRDYELAYLKKEIQNFIDTFERQPMVLDLGCGNGYSIEQLSEAFPRAYFLGIEPQPELLEITKARNLENAKFKSGSALDSSFAEHPFDIVITERVIINLISAEDQEKAMSNIAASLVPGGNYLMIESFVEPLMKINKFRKENLLGDAIKQSDHNLYMKFSILRKLTKYGLFTQPIEDIDALSPYFFLSRVFHPLTRKEGAKFKENSLINGLDAAGSFEKMKGEFLSPIQFLKFAKKNV
jgi:SAM-dependent methyltransferase